MKAQLSLELLIYLSLASSAALASMVAFSKMLSDASSIASAYAIEEFVSSLNSALIFGNKSASLYIPKGMCTAKISGQSIIIGNSTYALVEPIQGNAFCPDGIEATLNITYFNGYALIRR
ncbi:MAG: hypothetical protein ACP5GD_01150 [Candidatus Micrarchaeia archaeon]